MGDFCGFKVVVDEAMPRDEIHLRDPTTGKTLYVIKAPLTPRPINAIAFPEATVAPGALRSRALLRSGV